ncbi:TldD/PmbA family protein [Thermococcus peptonophilus]|uniref:Peptidase n=1 Tax=Thermococcus peptonophilus TaxID=53952 RepID=A0A142CUM1_9EURY|nr:TldD/PmbA family protein [Thermococcus peptonophilus]AMQ18473.1 peptidase [Thermococcus peptonophilus]
MIDVIESLAEILNSKNVEWEIYWESGRSGSFRIEREALERSQRKFYSGISLRVGLNGKLGFSYITGIHHSLSELEKFVERTMKLAKVSEVPFRGFPVPSKVPGVKGIYDRRIEEIPFEDAHALALQYAEKMRELKGKETLSGSISLAFERYGVVNSNGVELEASSTYMGVSTYAVREDRPGNGSFYQSYRSLQGVEALEEAILKAKEDAELSARARKVEPYDGELVLEPEAVMSVVEVLLENFYGDEVYYGRSRFFTLGEPVASDAFTLVDDSTLEGLPGSYPFDGEGTPGQRSYLIENGILKGFLLDHTYAALLGLKSTGNAVRSFRTTPSIGASNLVVEPGEESLEDFEGVIIKSVFGEHTANPVSGDFSLPVGLGYVVKNGEVIPFKDNMLVGNVFDLLKTAEPGRVVKRISSFMAPRVKVHAKIV